MTKANRIISALLALFMTASVAQISALAEDVLPEDIPETEESRSSAEEEFPEEENDSEESAIDDIYLYENEVVAPVEYEVQANLSSKRQAVVDRAYAWYNSTWTLTQPLVLWHNPASSSGITIPAGTTVRGIPYTQFNCLYSIDGTLPGSTDYFSLDESSTYATVVNTYCPGVQSNRTAPKYGAECVQLVYDAWYHGDDSIGKRDVSWSLIIGDNKKRGLVDEIEYSAIQPGDALAISSHIRLVVGVNDNNTPDDCTDDSYEIIEQTTSYLSTSNIGTSKATYTYTQLNNGGYVPYRYNKLDDGTVVDPDPESYTLSGVIRNATEGSADYGKAVEGVTVTRKASDGTVIDSAVTDATGTFSFTFTGEKGDYIFVLSKAGFQTFTTAAMTIHQTSPSLGAFVIYEEETEAEIIASGICGDNLTWTLDDAGTLTISGEGAMKDYSYNSSPWKDYCYSYYEKSPQIKSIIVKDGVTTIGQYAFYDCRRATSVYLSNSLIEIRWSAFQRCELLDNIVLPDSLLCIRSQAFADCTGLTAITIPKNVWIIDSSPFDKCTNLSSIHVNNDNEFFRDIEGVLYKVSKEWNYEKQKYDFSFTELLCCPAGSALTEVVIPDTVTSVASDAFAYCSALLEITIPNSVTEIKSGVFFRCSNLQTIVLHDAITSIGSLALNGCQKLRELNLPKNLNYIDESALGDCYCLSKIYIDDTNPNFCTDSMGVLYNKSKDTLIKFPARNNVLNYIIPSTVTKLNNDAMQNCIYLESIELPQNLVEIGWSAFENCIKLQSITIPETVSTIGHSAFSGCTNLTDVSLPDTIPYFGTGVFQKCTNLQGITLPKNMKKLPSYTFQECTSLTAIIWPTELKTIDYSAFMKCNNLCEITIPDSVTSIGSSAFQDCSNLTIVSIPNSVTSIGSWAFYRCSSLTTVTIPDSVYSIISDNVSSIGMGAFQDCSSLTTVSIPENITSLSSQCFYNCTSLTSVYFYGDAPTIASKNTFSQTPSSLILYYISGKSGWTSPTWNGYNTATFTPGDVDPKPTIPGDISGDGVLDYFDVTALYAAYQSGEVDAEVMDVNHDGVVDYYDVSKLYAAFRGTAVMP